MVAIFHRVAIATAATAVCASAATNLRNEQYEPVNYGLPIEVTVTVTETYCPADNPTPPVSTPANPPPVEISSTSALPPVTPYVPGTTSTGVPGTESSVTIPSTTVTLVSTTPVTTGVPGTESSGTMPLVSVSSDTSTGGTTATVFTAHSVHSTSSAVVTPSTTTARGDAASTAVNYGLMGLVALAALYGV